MSTNMCPDTISLNSTMYPVISPVTNPSNVQTLASITCVQDDYQGNSFMQFMHYIANKIKSFFGYDIDDVGINPYYGDLANIQELKKLLDVGALAFNIDGISRIYVVDDMTQFGGGANTQGLTYYNHPVYHNSMFISKSLSSTVFKGVLIHELGHFVTHPLYENYAVPYAQGNSTARDIYHKAIADTLININSDLGNQVNTTSDDTTYKAGNSIEGIYSPQLATISLKAQLGCIFSPSCLTKEGVVMDTIQNMFNLYNPSLYNCAQTEDQAGQENSVEEAEFWVRYNQQIAQGDDPANLAILQPLVNFLTQYIYPDMDQYLSHHNATQSLASLAGNITYQAEL